MWAILDRWMARFATLLAFFVLARILSPAEMSKVAWVTFSSALAGLITESGIAALLMNEKSEPSPARLSEAQFATQVVAGALAALSALVGFLYLSAGENQQAIALFVTAVGHLIIPWNAIPYAMLARRLDYKRLAVRRATSQLSGAAAAIILAYAGAGPTAVAGQYLISAAVSAVMLRRSGTRVSLKTESVREGLKYLRRGVAVTGSTMVPFLGQQVFLLSLPLLVSRNNAGEVVFVLTLFSVAADLIATVIGTVYWPVLARLRAVRTGTSELADALKVGAILGSTTTLVGLGGCLALFALLAGDKWVPAQPLLWLLLGTLPALTWTQMNRARLLSAGLVRLEISLTLWSALTIALPFAAATTGGLTFIGLAFQVRAMLMVIVRMVLVPASIDPDVVSLERMLGLRTLVLIAVSDLLAYLFSPAPARDVSTTVGALLFIVGAIALLGSRALPRFHRLSSGQLA
jgi:O-antigen/teichoic acid export membrane protein